MRRSRLSGPESRRRGRPGAGARGPPRRSQAASRPLIRNSFGMNSGVPASLPWPTHRFLPGPPQQGGRHGRACLDPRPTLNPLGVGHAPPAPHPPAGSSQEGALWGVLAGGHCPSATPAWPGLARIASQQLQLPSWGWEGWGGCTGPEGKARQAWRGQSPPNPRFHQKRSEGGLLLGRWCQSQLEHLSHWIPLSCSQFPPP